MKIIFKEEYKNKEKKVLKYFQDIHSSISVKPKLKKQSKQNKKEIYKTMDKLEKEKSSLKKKLSKKKVVIIDDYQFENI